MLDIKKISVGIRNSQLSIVQSNQFVERFISFHSHFSRKDIVINHIKTSGDIYKDHRLDQLGGKGLFIREIEEHIIQEKIDLGVHSMKDMPHTLPTDYEIACWMPRYDVRDVLVTQDNIDHTIASLPAGSIVGTSSIRRRSQILNQRKDLTIKSIRGNIDTRLKKMRNGEYDAIILAHAGLLRLNATNEISQIFDKKLFVPAACQGAVGIQILSKNSQLRELLRPISDHHTELCCKAEREVLNMIDANCNSPIGVLAEIENEKMNIYVQLFDHEGESIFYSSIDGNKDEYNKISQIIGSELIDQVGIKKIKQLDKLQDDFNYSPKK